MFHQVDLKQLAELTGPERAFVSLYLRGEAGLNGLGDRAERVRELLAGEPAELEHFEESLKLARAWLEEHSFAEPAVCVFACWALDFVGGCPLSVAVPDVLWVGSAPYLRPLAELQDEYESFVVVAADNRATRIYLVASAEAEQEGSVRGDVKNRVKKGGWSQKRYSRRRDNELLHYAKEVAERLAELDREESFDRIVLLGSKEALGEIEAALPRELADRVVGAKAVDLGEGEEELMDEAFELFFEGERQDEKRLWERIKEEYLGNGLAAMGPKAVLAAVLVGRVEAIAVTRDAKLTGTRCRECENVVYGRPRTCQICGSKSVFQVDLVDELVRQAARTGAEVDFTDPIEGLTKVGDVAALLRY